MGPSKEALALADFLIARYGLTADRYQLAYAIMEHEEKAMRSEPEQVGEVQGRPDIAAVLDRCIRELRSFIDVAHDYDLDEMAVQALETAIESMELRKQPAQGIDFAQLRDEAICDGVISALTTLQCLGMGRGCSYHTEIVNSHGRERLIGRALATNSAIEAGLIDQRDAAPGVDR